MTTESPINSAIVDRSSIRRALGRVMTSAGLAWESFESADGFLAKQGPYPTRPPAPHRISL